MGFTFYRARDHVRELPPGAAKDQAWVPGGLLFAWLAERGHTKPGQLKGYRYARHDTPLFGRRFDLVENGVIADDWLTWDATRFLAVLLRDPVHGPLGAGGSYWTDLAELAGGHPFAVRDHPDSYHALCARLDQRFEEWVGAGRPRGPETRLRPAPPDGTERSLVAPEPGMREVGLLWGGDDWPARNRLVRWRARAAAQVEAIRELDPGWALWYDPGPHDVVEPGALGQLVLVERIAEDHGSVELVFPPIVRARLLTRHGAGRATVEVLARPEPALSAGAWARAHELDPDWEADGPVRVGELADAVACLRLDLHGVRQRGVAPLERALLEALDPMDGVDLALRLGGMAPYP